MDPQRGRVRGSGMVTPKEEFYLEKEVVQPVPSIVETVDATQLTRLTREVTKLGAVAFQGGTDYLLADQWIENMETYYDMVVCTDMEKKITATFLLQGEAGRWWDSVMKTRNISTMTWEGFVELFRDMYLPTSRREKLEVDFISLIQGTMSVKDYEARFSQLYRFVRPMDPVSLARKFQRGLNLVIRDWVTPFQLPTVALIFASALGFEQELLTSRGEMTTMGDSRGRGKVVVESSSEPDTQGGSWKRRRTHQQEPARVAAALVGQVAHLRCFNCGELGHVSRACTKPRSKVCFRCGQTGHVARECTRPQASGQGTQ
ncbi:uncharacterized protein LOC133720788 [Rosa rugosa]|uniref:uncharacterized protein LOC133720788 n=1 Tax=Rosa rugosa TaxID=74645 RepID=UPI002B406D00|nr:uncharacterized protein LOC133720788 [Rosa rugosa]XP_062003242.1 uncharacterized protein LOC133720788 [Rosa rugosa]XP_062003243.1 uncharacterized protein LOC133720788 [Rosa rugosa]XP_062003244.1 uncharacterized protein LOC133720788 [Rosa rugosa]